MSTTVQFLFPEANVFDYRYQEQELARAHS